MDIVKKTVKVGSRSKTLLIPMTKDDPSYNQYLIQAETEKAENELRKAGDKRFVKPTDKEAIGSIKEQRDWLRHKQQTGSRMFGGITLESR